MNHPVFLVTPSERASSQELIPFLALTIIQVAGSHLSSPRGLSSKIVPTFTLNCFLQPLQFQIRRAFIRSPTFLELQRGQRTPRGQRIAAKNSWQIPASPK